MGVFRLTEYLNQVALWEETELKDTRVVVDGSALLYHLYCQEPDKLDAQCGGQYKTFHDKIVDFFKCLKENRVEPYVLLDGASAPSGNKLKTFGERLKGKIKGVLSQKGQILPLLATRTFIQTMETISGVKFAVCDG